MVDFSGSFPHDLLDLNDWRWQGPVRNDGSLGKEGDGRAVSIPGDEADTSTMERYRDDPWFVLETEGDGAPYVRLRSPAKGSTTSTSGRPTTRSELREMHFPDRDRKSSWDAGSSMVHNLKVRLAVAKVMEKNGKRSRVAIAQVHKTVEDGILVYLDGQSRKLRWKQDSEVQPDPLGDYELGEYVNIGLSVHGGICTIYVDDQKKAEGKLTGSAAKTSYFKTGCYNQDNNRDDGYPEDAFNEVHVAAVKVQHDVPWAPGGYEPVGPRVGTTQGEPEEPRSGGHGSKPCDVIDSIKNKRWKLNLDTNAAGTHSATKGDSVEKSAEELADGFAFDEHFDVVEGGTAVRFRAHVEGTTTDTSDYPRTELREVKSADPSADAEWNTADTAVHRLTAWAKVTHAPSTKKHTGVVIGQIHDEDDDVLEIMYHGEKGALGYRWNGKWQDDDVLIAPQEFPGDGWFGYRIEVSSKTVRIAVDTGGGFHTKVTKSDVKKTKCYFKAGAYTQSSLIAKHGATKGDFGEALFRSIVVEGS